MDIIKCIINKAKQNNSTIILPEANLDERVKSACKIILKNKLSKIIVFGKKEEFSKEFFCDNCQILDIENFEKYNEFANQLFELRKNKGMTIEKAQELLKHPVYFGCMLLKNNMADGMVAGASFSTGETMLPALQIVKLKPNKTVATGNMIMVKKGKNPLVFGDVSLVTQPTKEQLAEIAISNAEFMKNVLNIEPKVAMLSFSTKGSAVNDMTTFVKDATDIAKTNSNFSIDGEMQVDSALDIETAKRKGVSAEVGGKANVLIFPDLNAGNIGYKLVSRLAGYEAIGPIMLNLNKPVNDLSRGCTINEIVNTVCITKLLVEKR